MKSTYGSQVFQLYPFAYKTDTKWYQRHTQVRFGTTTALLPTQ